MSRISAREPKPDEDRGDRQPQCAPPLQQTNVIGRGLLARPHLSSAPGMQTTGRGILT